MLYCAVSYVVLQEATRLLEDPAQQYSAARALTLTDGSELTPLHVAYSQQNYAAVQLLVSKGACVNVNVSL
jgi:ankyrin repeat protein